MPLLIPNSNGESAELHEFNPCHSKQDGKFTSKGGGGGVACSGGEVISGEEARRREQALTTAAAPAPYPGFGKGEPQHKGTLYLLRRIERGKSAYFAGERGEERAAMLRQRLGMPQINPRFKGAEAQARLTAKNAGILQSWRHAPVGKDLEQVRQAQERTQQKKMQAQLARQREYYQTQLTHIENALADGTVPVSQVDRAIDTRDRIRRVLAAEQVQSQSQAYELNRQILQTYAQVPVSTPAVMGREGLKLEGRKGENIRSRHDRASKAIEAEVLQGRFTAMDLAEDMVKDLTFERFDVTARTEGRVEHDPSSDSAAKKQYERYREEAIDRMDEAHQEQWAHERDAEMRATHSRMRNEILPLFDEAVEESRAQAKAEAEQGHLFGAPKPPPVEEYGSDEARVAFAGEILSRIDPSGPLTEDERGQLREYFRGHPATRVPHPDLAFPSTDHAEQAVEQAHPQWDRDEGYSRWRDHNEPDYDEVQSYESWYEENYAGGGYGDPTVVVRAQGDKDTRVDRTIWRNSDGELEVHHDYFAISDEAPLGAGKTVLRNSMENYQKIGVAKVTTLANIDVGSYAWMKYGFLPDNPGSFQRQMLNRLEDFKGAGKIGWYDVKVEDGRRTSTLREVTLTPKLTAALNKLIRSGDHRLAWRLSDAKVGGLSIGKAFMMHMSYAATLRLDDEEQMTRFQRYVSGGMKRT